MRMGRSRLVGTVLAIAAILGAPLAAQRPTAGNAAPQPSHPMDLAVTYNPVRSHVLAGSGFWMQGGSLQFDAGVYHSLGVVAEAAGMHAGQIHGSGVGVDMLTAVAGPRYTLSPAGKRYVLFGQALFGGAHGYNSLFPATGAPENRANSFAMEMGGGVNVNWTQRVALRLCEADWLRTTFPNSSANAQNSLKLGFGVVFRLK